ncbi:MAG: MarR family transcriptional regulator [Sphingobacteriia bacterium]|nr:MarR family transcriptional regulator [Sphingobacteriia bacterium]
MEIGEEIQQKKFSSAFQKATINILFTSSWLQLEQTHILREFDISPQQFNVLRILKGRHPEPGSVAIIQERMLDRMSNASRLVDKLEAKKLVVRKPCKEDRRQVNVSITEEGMALLLKVNEFIQIQEGRFNKLTEEEALLLSDLLDRFRG